MKKPKLPFRLPLEDQQLLTARFYIRDPRRLPDLRERVPAGVDLIEVLQTYDIPPCPRPTWPRCCTCKPRTRHRRGYVASFSDGGVGLLGHDCGTVRHNLDYSSMIAQFDANAKRAGLLRQVIKCFDCAVQLRAFAGTVRTDPALHELQGFHQALKRDLPRFHVRFQQATDGRLRGVQRVADHDAMRARDDRLDAKLHRMARNSRVSRDDLGVDKALLAELVVSGDPDASKERITKKVETMIHQFSGSSLFTAVPGAGVRLQRLEQAVANILKDIDEAAPSRIPDTSLRSYVTALTREIEAAGRLRREIVDACTFVAPETISGVVGIWNRLHASKPPEQVEVRGSALRRGGAGEGVPIPAPREVAIPDVPARLLRELTEAFEQQEE